MKIESIILVLASYHIGIGTACFVYAAISGRWIMFAIGAFCWLAAREIVAAYGAQSE